MQRVTSWLSKRGSLNDVADGRGRLVRTNLVVKSIEGVFPLAARAALARHPQTGVRCSRCSQVGGRSRSCRRTDFSAKRLLRGCFDKFFHNRARRGAINSEAFFHGQGQFLKFAIAIAERRAAGSAVCVLPYNAERRAYDAPGAKPPSSHESRLITVPPFRVRAVVGV